jgi:nucleotide-binding universal stress UspA family protein
MTRLRSILVPIDFSPGSLSAAAYARDLAEMSHSHVHLLHVAQPPDVSAGGPYWHDSQTLQEPVSRRALDRLATLSMALEFYPVRTTGIVRFGRADEVIGEYAEQIQADLIVMGIHGDHTVPVGEVIEHVLGRTRRAVLAVPEDESPVARVVQIEEALEQVA